MSMMFGHIFNLVLKFFFGSNDAPNTCFVTQIGSYRQRSEHMDKRKSNVTDVSPTLGIIC